MASGGCHPTTVLLSVNRMTLSRLPAAAPASFGSGWSIA